MSDDLGHRKVTLVSTLGSRNTPASRIDSQSLWSLPRRSSCPRRNPLENMRKIYKLMTDPRLARDAGSLKKWREYDPTLQSDLYVSEIIRHDPGTIPHRLERPRGSNIAKTRFQKNVFENVPDVTFRSYRVSTSWISVSC